LEDLLADATVGEPTRGLKWTRKALRKVAKALRRKGFKVSHETVRRLLRQLRYRLRVNRKHLGKRQDGERDQQLRYLTRKRRAFLKAGKPVISVDTKKKELIGNFRNPGRTWRHEALSVLATDFPSDADGKAIPYGVYDSAQNLGFLGIGTSHETAEFAVNVIRAWWQTEGRAAYPSQHELLIQADSGGANGYRSWLWKWELQHLADETGLTLTVTHYPTSASKWNWIEHRLFSQISQNWAGQPLIDYETILKFIRTTRTEQGLHCVAYLDTADYALGRTLSIEHKQSINVRQHRVLPKWNYTIKPRAIDQVIS
jgi:hypothetical protein